MTTLSRKYIDDNDVVARYLADQLTDEEREAFEAYYLEHPEVVQELNAVAQFKSGLVELQRSGTLQSILGRRPWWQRAPNLAIAASLVVAIVAGSVWFHRQDAASPILATSMAEFSGGRQTPLAIGASYDLQRTRSSSYDATIKLPREAAGIELRVKPDAPAQPAIYRAELSVVNEDSSKRLSEANRIVAADDGFVAIFLNSSVLRPGVYELKVAGDVGTSSADAPTSFLLEFVASD
jgi:hypothetical protein